MKIGLPVREKKIFERFLLGMSFGVKFKVRTFGNKHPDGSNVRNFSDHAIYYMYIYISVNRVLR